MLIVSCMFGRGGGRGEVGIKGVALKMGLYRQGRTGPVLYHDRYERRAGMEQIKMRLCGTRHPRF